VLGDLKEQRGAPYALKDLSEPANRRAAIIALGLMGDPRGTLALIPFLKDPVLAIDAVNALGNIGDGRAAAAVLEKLKDPEIQFTGAGVWALQRMGKSAVGVLVPALQAGSVNQRRCAAQGLIGTNDPAAIPGLRQALADPDEMVRRHAAQALGWRGNAAAIEPGFQPALDTAASELIAEPGTRVVVEGHTDDVGGEAYNYELGLRRAEAVRDYLISRGVAADRLTVKSFGMTRPLASNATEEGRAQNRRVELHISNGAQKNVTP